MTKTIKSYFKYIEATNVTIDLITGDYHADYNGFHIWIMKYRTQSVSYIVNINYLGETLISGNGVDTQKNVTMFIKEVISNTLKEKKEF